MRPITWGAPSGPPKPHFRSLKGSARRPSAAHLALPRSSISRLAAVVAVIVLSAGCAGMKSGGSAPAAVTRTLLNPTWLGAPPSDFTQTIAVSGGQTVYVSAQTAWDPNRNAVVGPGDFRAQAVRTFERLKVAVEAANASLADVVRLTI